MQTISSDWQPVENETDLILWEAAWKKSGSSTPHRMFNAQMLQQSEICFLGLKTHGEYLAGCIANQSRDSIGISNVFSASPSADVFAQATGAVASIAPHKPIVGYESGADLDYAKRAGFISVGDLRILFAKAARFQS